MNTNITTEETEMPHETDAAPMEYVDKCVFCGSTDFRPVLKGKDRMYGHAGEFSVVECLSCGLAWTRPRPTRQYILKYYGLPDDRESYNPHSLCTQNMLHSRMRRIVLSSYYASPSKSNRPRNPLLRLYAFVFKHMVEGYPKYRPGRLLDVGCGAANALLELKAAGWETFGLDFASEAVSAARAKGLDVYQGELTDEAFRQAPFEVVRMWHSLEHTYDPIEYLKNARSILAPGGELIIGVPNWGSVFRRFFRSHWFFNELPRHLYHFSVNTITRILNELGFQDIRCHVYQGRGNLHVSILSVIRTALQINTPLANSSLHGAPIAVVSLLPFELLLTLLHVGDTIDIRAIKPTSVNTD